MTRNLFKYLNYIIKSGSIAFLDASSLKLIKIYKNIHSNIAFTG